MVLVDPSLLMNADPAAAPPAPTVKASRKKQQKLLEQQQQQQAGQDEQLAQQVAAALLQSADPAAVAAGEDVQHDLSDAVQLPEGEHSAAAAAAAATTSLQQAVLFQQQQQRHQGEEEPWQTVLRLRMERRQAARERRRQRQQQQDAEGLGHATHASGQSRSSSSIRQSPVRRLLAFAAATGLSADQALQLWLQEPALSQLPAAAVANQVAELSQALGFERGSSIQQQLAADSNSSGSSRPVLQVLVKEPELLALPQQQLAENMQGLSDLLGLQAAAVAAAAAVQDQTSLLPLLWEQPGLLLLPPEVSEYRLQHLAGLLQLSVPRTLQLVLQQPQLLTERPVFLASRLGSLCTMLGVARAVAAECVLREPRMLCVDEGELQGRWEKLVGRFGWAPDALDVVMADPGSLMRDSMDE